MKAEDLLNKLRALKAQPLDNKKIALIILVCLIIIYVDFTALVKLQLKAIKTVSPKAARLKTDIKRLTKDLNNLKNKQQIEIKEKGRAQVKKIILEKEIHPLLEKMSVLANKHNVKIIKILPAKDPKSKLASVLITLDLICDYHHLGAFLNDLENAQDFISVEGIKIKSKDDDYFQQNVNLVLRTYVKK